LYGRNVEALHKPSLLNMDNSRNYLTSIFVHAIFSHAFSGKRRQHETVRKTLQQQLGSN
jgi:stress-induced morphogen